MFNDSQEACVRTNDAERRKHLEQLEIEEKKRLKRLERDEKEDIKTAIDDLYSFNNKLLELHPMALAFVRAALKESLFKDFR